MTQTLWDTNKGQNVFPWMSPAGIGQGTDPAPAGNFSGAPSVAGQTAAASGLVAGTTHTLAGATKLTGLVNTVATVAVASDAVALPAAVAAMVGSEIVVINLGAQTLAIWPQVADAVDGGSAGVAVTLTVAHRGATFYCNAVNSWVSSLFGAVSS